MIGRLTYSSTAITYDIGQVATRLGLGKTSRATKREWRYGRQGSLSLDLHKNVWTDHEAGEGGGVLDLVVRYKGGTRRDAARWLEGRTWEPPRSTAPAPQSDRLPEARAYWKQTKPAIHTPAQAYLEARGILVPIPPAIIRYHEGDNALVAGLQRFDGTFCGLQRIYLEDNWHKGKRSLGPISGGAVRLTPVAETIQLCESVEDGLALLQLTGRPTWAVPGASFMASFEPPPEVREVILAPDNDEAGHKVIEKAAANRNRGAIFRQLFPPVGMDWSAVLEDYEERIAIQEEPGPWVEESVDGV